MCPSLCLSFFVSYVQSRTYRLSETHQNVHNRVDSKNLTRPLWRLALVPGDLEGHNQSLLKAMGALIKSHENLRKQVDWRLWFDVIYAHTTVVHVTIKSFKCDLFNNRSREAKEQFGDCLNYKLVSQRYVKSCR